MKLLASDANEPPIVMAPVPSTFGSPASTGLHTASPLMSVNTTFGPEMDGLCCWHAATGPAFAAWSFQKYTAMLGIGWFVIVVTIRSRYPGVTVDPT